MIRTTTLAAVLSAAIGPAMALSVPPPGVIDPHIRTVAYDQMNRTALVGEIGRETTVTFGSDERIERVVFGQPEAELWLGPDPKDVKDQALRNNLPLWPMKPGLTNMQVTTLTPAAISGSTSFHSLPRCQTARAATIPMSCSG